MQPDRTIDKQIVQSTLVPVPKPSDVQGLYVSMKTFDKALDLEALRKKL
jgi:hypothetical protein